jgi:hypothetical protein
VFCLCSMAHVGSHASQVAHPGYAQSACSQPLTICCGAHLLIQAPLQHVWAAAHKAVWPGASRNCSTPAQQTRVRAPTEGWFNSRWWWHVTAGKRGGACVPFPCTKCRAPAAALAAGQSTADLGCEWVSGVLFGVCVWVLWVSS